MPRKQNTKSIPKTNTKNSSSKNNSINSDQDVNSEKNEFQQNQDFDSFYNIKWLNEILEYEITETFWINQEDQRNFNSDFLTSIIPCEKVIINDQFSRKRWNHKKLVINCEWFYVFIENEETEETTNVPIYCEISNFDKLIGKRGRKKKTANTNIPIEIIVEIHNIIVRFYEQGILPSNLIAILIDRFNRKIDYFNQTKDEIIEELRNLLTEKCRLEIPLNEKEVSELTNEIFENNQTLQEKDRKQRDEIEKFIIGSHNCSYDKLRSGPFKRYIGSSITSFLNNKIYIRGVTCNVSPEQLTKEGIHEESQAWIKIRQRIDNIIELLKSLNEILFILLVIETHPGKRSHHKKKPKSIQVKLTSKGTPFPIRFLEGFPHIHCAIGFCKHSSKCVSQDDLTRIFEKEFDDVDVDGSSKDTKNEEGGDPLKIIRYIVKNARHIQSFEKLSGYYPLSLYDFTSDNEVRNYFEKYKKFNVEYNYQTVQKSSSSSLTQKQVKYLTPMDRCFTFVKGYMENNKHFLCRKQIYKIVDGSRRTYEPLKNENGKPMSLEEYYSNLISDESEIGTMMSSEDKIVKYMRTSGKFLPKIQTSYDWMEFQDFYVFFKKEGIQYHRTCKVEACCKFINNYTWSQRLQKETPEMWYSIITNQQFSKEIEEELLTSLFKILLHKIERDPSLYLIGQPNSGKTTLLECVLNLLPELCIMYFTRRCGNFIFSDLAFADHDSKSVLNCDEVGALESFEMKELYDLLGGRFKNKVNIKYGTPEKIESKINVVIASNDDRLNFFERNYEEYYEYIETYDNFTRDEPFREEGTTEREFRKEKRLYNKLKGKYTEQKALDSRLHRVQFLRPIRNVEPDAKKNIIKNELGKIFFFLADQFYAEQSNILNLID